MSRAPPNIRTVYDSVFLVCDLKLFMMYTLSNIDLYIIFIFLCKFKLYNMTK